MKRLVLLLIGLSLLAAACREQPVSRDDVFLVMDSLEHKFDWLGYRLQQETWEIYSTGQSDSLDFYQGLLRYTVADPNLLRTFRQGRLWVTENEDVRRLDLLEAALMRAQVEVAEPVASLHDSLVQIDVTFRAPFDGQNRTQNYLYRTYRSDPDRSRREAAFRAYHRIGDLLADGLARLIRLRNREAAKFGQQNYFSLLFSQQGFDEARYLATLDQLDSLSLGPYRRILANAGEKLGSGPVEIWDLAFAYADINRRGDAYFPADRQFSQIARSLEALGYDLDKLPIYFDLQPRSDKTQLAYAVPLRPPHDVRVLANVTDGYLSARTLMHEIGHALHFAHIRQERQLFVDCVSEAWTEGMAQIFASLLDDPQWLVQYAGMTPETAAEFLRARAEQEIIYLRTTLMRLRWEYEAYRNPDQDFNTLYWDLFARYLLLPRHDDIRPWATIIQYTTHPVYLHNYLYADMIASQTLASLHTVYGPLIDNPSLRSFLNQNYFRFGARYDWRDLLERGTGQRLDQNYLIRRLCIEPPAAAF